MSSRISSEVVGDVKSVPKSGSGKSGSGSGKNGKGKEKSTEGGGSSKSTSVSAGAIVSAKRRGSSMFKSQRLSKLRKSRRKASKEAVQPPAQLQPLAPITRIHPRHLQGQSDSPAPGSPARRSEVVGAEPAPTYVQNFDHSNDETELKPVNSLSPPQKILRMLSRGNSQAKEKKKPSLSDSNDDNISGDGSLMASFAPKSVLSKSNSSAGEESSHNADFDGMVPLKSLSLTDGTDGSKKKKTISSRFTFIKRLFSKSNSTKALIMEKMSGKNVVGLKKSLYAQQKSFSRLTSMSSEDGGSAPVLDAPIDKVDNRSSSCRKMTCSESFESLEEIPVARQRKKSKVMLFSNTSAKQSKIALEAAQLNDAIEKKIEYISHMDHIEHSEELEISTKEKRNASHWGESSIYSIAANDYDVTKHVVPRSSYRSDRATNANPSRGLYSDDELSDTEF